MYNEIILRRNHQRQRLLKTLACCRLLWQKSEWVLSWVGAGSREQATAMCLLPWCGLPLCLAEQAAEERAGNRTVTSLIVRKADNLVVYW